MCARFALINEFDVLTDVYFKLAFFFRKIFLCTQRRPSSLEIEMLPGSLLALSGAQPRDQLSLGCSSLFERLIHTQSGNSLDNHRRSTFIGKTILACVCFKNGWFVKEMGGRPDSLLPVVTSSPLLWYI